MDHRTPLPGLLAALALLLLPSCQGAYYGAMERIGKEKRHILADRVKDGRDEQREAQEQVLSTYEIFQQATGFDGGELESYYKKLDGEYRRSEAKAEDVRRRIRSIEQVAGDLFDEWEEEIELISSANLRRSSAANLRQTRKRYERLIASMRKASSSMDPVLGAFRDQVLFLKHNLNAAAIASLEDNARSIRRDVDVLVRSMEASIAEADAFIEALDT